MCVVVVVLVCVCVLLLFGVFLLVVVVFCFVFLNLWRQLFVLFFVQYFIESAFVSDPLFVLLFSPVNQST